jgi:hypothetical protein
MLEGKHLDHTYRVWAQNSMQHHLDMPATEVQHSRSATISMHSLMQKIYINPTYASQNILQLPLQHNDCTSVQKCNDAVGVIMCSTSGVPKPCQCKQDI